MAGELTTPVRIWRLVPWSRNALMRPSDRLESVIVIVVVAVVLLLLPVAAAFGTATYTRLRDQARVEGATRSEVSAVLVEDAVRVYNEDAVRGTGGPDVGQARVHWSVGGIGHTHMIDADSEAKAGDAVSIWVDANGNLSAAPMTGGESAVAAVIGAIAVWATSIIAGVLFLLGVHWSASRHRLAQWNREWAGIGKAPGWPVS
ncbi:Rv1733c family protein [Rhodococcus sp. T7]|uniref:Rv1733c family protein n=1 Tax=Rhodococcus sp. T7 TaxID=627444 RepID=UPI00135A16A6|nr:hypothetical protein [Rhodococcus sp. T7]KAF0961130.1 hypothetical protein MLGJGCBP_05789 [Rhodococcus sp. T7]